MNFVYFGFLSASSCCPFPPSPSFLVSIVSLDPIYCCICSFGPRSFFFPYQLFARQWVCESCLIYSSVESHAGQESSSGYSVNVCVCVCLWKTDRASEREGQCVSVYASKKEKLLQLVFTPMTKTRDVFVFQFVMFICFSQHGLVCCLPSCLIGYSTFCVGMCLHVMWM